MACAATLSELDPRRVAAPVAPEPLPAAGSGATSLPWVFDDLCAQWINGRYISADDWNRLA